jgi:hypothetical protein
LERTENFNKKKFERESFEKNQKKFEEKSFASKIKKIGKMFCKKLLQKKLVQNVF